MSAYPPLRAERRGSGPPLVLLHGYGANRFTWRHWVETLERRHELHLVDLKGFGSAPKPADRRYGPADHAEVVHEWMVREGIGGATVVGHSLGGGIALLLGLRLLDEGGGRLSRLVNIAGPAYRQSIPRYIGLARLPLLGKALLAALPPRWMVRTVLHEIVYDRAEVSELQVEAYAGPLRHPAGRHAAVETARRIVPPDLDRIVARYGELDVPTLLLWGRQDTVIPLEVGRRLERELPRARLVVLERCGHIPQEERPEEALEALTSFLDG